MALIDGDDLGRKLVDENLEDLETKIERIYSDACDDMQKKLDRFLARFEAQDAQMQETLSQEEYQHWREIQILQSDRMRIQIEALSRDAVNADRLAAEMINNDMPYVYSTSYNFATFRGEMMAEYANVPMPAVPMMNMEAFRILATEDPTLLPVNIDIEEDLRWNQQHITSAITQGIVQGESIPQISRRLRQVTDMDARAARRNARTACTYIENRGRREGVKKLKDAGIPFDEPWNATIDDRTRETHVLLHGTLPNEDGYYGEGILDIRHKPLMREPADPDGALDEIYNCRCCVKAWLQGIDHSDFEDRYARFMTEEHFEDWQRLGEERDRNGYAEQERRFEERRQTAQARNEEIRRAYEEEQRQAEPEIIPDNLPQGVLNIIGDKGQPIDAETLCQTVNPNYPNRGYTDNCQRCAACYELGRRGYDVEALAFDGHYPSTEVIFNQRVQARSGDQYGSYITSESYSRIFASSQYPFNRSARTTSNSIRQAMLDWGDGSRATLSVTWRNSNSSHVVNVENFGGNVRIVDTQCGRIYDDIERYMSQCKCAETELRRMDILNFQDDMSMGYLKILCRKRG